MSEYNKIIIITGASRGIGAEIANQTNIKNEKCIFLLMARNIDKLEEIRNEMSKKNPKNLVLTVQLDFSKAKKVDDLAKIIDSLFKSHDISKVNELLVFYNHGTLRMGSIETNADHASEQFQINVISVWVLLSAIRKLFTLEKIPSQFHVNISTSLADFQHESFSIYNTTRTARATIFKCLALEQPLIRVLNYQPGPVYTEMLKQVYDHDDNSESKFLKSFREEFRDGKFIKPECTIEVLLDVLYKNKFANGSSIDYYDEILSF